ncbi:uncharacterized protein, partial [Primulina huaijiensis]|uniref:uncharacterized protein n=1 Tax=Primulina huaijiensis TaxID=1492673 RepID=UPI003CC72018
MSDGKKGESSTAMDEHVGSKITTTYDNPSLQISPVKLDGTNYLAWSRSCLLFIQARGMQGYINGKITSNRADTSKWESENSLVMSWLINSIQPQLARGYLLLDTAQKIWEATAQTYSQSGNDAQIYELRRKIHETKQSEMTIAQYFSELSSLWQELDYYQDFQASCPADATKFHTLVEKERVYDFLAGLNDVFDQIRVQVLGKDPFPSLRHAYNYVQQEESRRNAMMPIISNEGSGMLVDSHTITTKYNAARSTSKGGEVQDEKKCEHCGKPNHTKATCWSIHGRPKR